MSAPLSTYLHDHLAGSKFAVDLLQSFTSQHEGTPLGEFAKDLLFEIEEDQQVLQSIIDRSGFELPAIKEAAAWISEKASRLKLAGGSGELGTFQTLEALALGILGKRALWTALRLVAGANDHLRDVDFATLVQRAEEQHAKVEQRRLEVALPALRGVA